MPVILEEVDPSWIEDGWGIQGDQNEVRFDDDIPWDITAWTRDNPDQDDFNCCAPAPIGCPTSVTFNGLEFCCIANDCAFPIAGSTRFFEPPTVNGVSMSLTDISSLPDCPIFCQGEDKELGRTTYVDQDCLIGPFDDTTIVNAYILQKDGIWHIALFGGGPGTMFFHATTADISSPVSNDLSCDIPDRCARNLDDLDPELEVCLFGGIFGVFVTIGAINGTATISI